MNESPSPQQGEPDELRKHLSLNLPLISLSRVAPVYKLVIRSPEKESERSQTTLLQKTRSSGTWFAESLVRDTSIHPKYFLGLNWRNKEQMENGKDLLRFQKQTVFSQQSYYVCLQCHRTQCAGENLNVNKGNFKSMESQK